MKRWLVIELFIPNGFGDAVSNFLIEQGSKGVEELEGDSRWEKLRAYFPQSGKEEGFLRALHRYLKSLQRMTPGIPRSQIKTSSIPEQDWGEKWKRFFKPLQVTSKFWVKPPWSRIRLNRGQIPITIAPGMAFGTGTHASTRLCIQALEERIKGKGLSVLDVGTGSGILAIVAARLKAKEVWGIDTDGVAVENARENVGLNHVSDSVKIKKGSIGHLPKKFDVVIANIDLKSLKRMRKPLLNHLKSHGILILSGLLKGEKDRLCEHYLRTGLLRWIKDAQEGEWVCLTFKKVS
jgi:ribosomal protein L11 methyltransferase